MMVHIQTKQDTIVHLLVFFFAELLGLSVRSFVAWTVEIVAAGRPKNEAFRTVR